MTQYYNAQNNVYIRSGSPFDLNGIQYPANWLNLSTPEEKAALGLEEVVATNSPANDQYYWVSTELNGASLTYINVPKDLTSVKDICFTQINQTAYNILQSSDWMVVKSIETSTKINADWNTYRANVRSVADSTKTAITGAADVDAVATIMGSIVWPTAPAPLASTQA